MKQVSCLQVHRQQVLFSLIKRPLARIPPQRKLEVRAAGAEEGGVLVVAEEEAAAAVQHINAVIV